MNTPRTNKSRTDDNGDPSWVFDLMEKLETELAAVKADYQKNDEQWIVRENELMAKLEKCRTSLENLEAAFQGTLDGIGGDFPTARQYLREAREALDQTK